MSAGKRAGELIIGGEPRIDFLPPEIKARNLARRSRRVLIAMVLIVVLVCAGGYGFATSLAVQSHDKLVQAQAETSRLIAEQGKYIEARTVTGSITSVENARLIGSATEILWADYLSELQSSLPSGAIVETFTVDSQPAFEGSPEVSVPLQRSRVANIIFTVRVPSLPVVDTLLVNLREMTGYADAYVASIALEEDSYLANVSLNVNAEAFEKRFFADADDAEAEEEEPADPANTATEESTEGEG